MIRTFLITAGFAFVLGASACGSVESNACNGDSDCLDQGQKFACDTDDTLQCMRRCVGQSDCLESQHCAMLQSKSFGVCRLGRITTP